MTLRDDAQLLGFVRSVVSQLEDPISPDFARSFVVDTSSKRVSVELVDLLVEEMLTVPAHVWQQTFGGLLEYDDQIELPLIKAPTLLVWGDADALVSREAQDGLVGSIPGADLVVYAGVGHSAWKTRSASAAIWRRSHAPFGQAPDRFLSPRGSPCDDASPVAETSEIRVLVVDDHTATRSGIKAILDSEVGITVVGEATNVESAVSMADRRKPDVVVMDLQLDGDMGGGFAATRGVLDADPEVGVMMFTAFGEHHLLTDGLEAGARGFMVEDATPAEMVRGVRIWPRAAPTSTRRSAPTRQAAGSARSRACPPASARSWRCWPTASRTARSPPSSTSPPTVRTHVRNAMRKLDADTRTQAVALAIRQRLIGSARRPRVDAGAMLTTMYSGDQEIRWARLHEFATSATSSRNDSSSATCGWRPAGWCWPSLRWLPC